MTAHRPWVTENTTQRERLRVLVARLSDAQLATPLPAGWTVAAVLAHLAFWDQRLLVLLQAWERTGTGAAPRTLDERDVDWINDAGKALCLALGARAAADLAVATAEAVDRAIEGLAEDRVAANRTAGTPLNLLRAEHRRVHLDEIEQVLRG
jgi:hypothetical protein